MNDIQLFNNADFGEMRAFLVDGEPVFVAKDVLAILEIDRTALRKLDDDEKGVYSIHTLGGEQKVSTVTEPGFYKLVMRSRKPEAKAFQRWVTHEVLPALRRSGLLGAPAEMFAPPAALTREQRAAALLRQSNELIGELQAENTELRAENDGLNERMALVMADNGELEAANARLSERVGQVAPKAALFDSHVAGNDAWFTVTEVARHTFQATGNRNATRDNLFKWLRADGMLTADRQATKKAVERGLFVNYIPPSRYDQRTGKLVPSKPYAKATMKGLDWAVGRYGNRGADLALSCA